jgi:hypothetical protein
LEEFPEEIQLIKIEGQFKGVFGAKNSRYSASTIPPIIILAMMNPCLHYIVPHDLLGNLRAFSVITELNENQLTLTSWFSITYLLLALWLKTPLGVGLRYLCGAACAEPSVCCQVENATPRFSAVGCQPSI